MNNNKSDKNINNILSTLQEEDFLSDDLAKNIWNKKYKNENESIQEFILRIAEPMKNTKDYKKCIQLLFDKKFLPAGRILANLNTGVNKITLSNCYCMGHVEDSLDSIFDTAKYLAKTYSRGGGCGIDLSKLSPMNTPIANAAKTTSGPVSFLGIYEKTTKPYLKYFNYLWGENILNINDDMELYDETTKTIGAGRRRRAALMITMDCNHPDIKEFIAVKNDLQKIIHANLSVKFTDKFLHAVKHKDTKFKLYFHRKENNEIIEKYINPIEMFDTISKFVWSQGEPGCLFWDRVLNWNLMSADPDYQITGTNPCSEQPLPTGGACLLGSLNLSEFVKFNSIKQEYDFDYEEFKKAVDIAVKYLNKILDINIHLHPLKIQREVAKNYRQIGLGVFNFAELLYKLKIYYGDSNCLDISNKIGKTMLIQALETSCELAKKEGSFPKCKKELLLKSPFLQTHLQEYPKLREKIRKYGLRNAHLLTIAPTGSLSNLCGGSGGIEPFYSLKYSRKVMLSDKLEIIDIIPNYVREYMEKNNIKNIDKLPEYFVTTFDINYMDRIEVQAVWQKYIDAGISSTVNLPEETTPEEIKELYLKAWKKGLKGITVFRSNCRREGILKKEEKKATAKKGEIKVLDKSKKQKISVELNKDFLFDSIIPIQRRTFGKTYGSTVGKQTGCGKIYLTLNHDNKGNLIETFLHTSKSGICNANISALNRMISLALRSGVKVEVIIEELRNIKCNSCIIQKNKGKFIEGLSCPDIIAKVIEEEYKILQKEKKEKEKELIEQTDKKQQELQKVENKKGKDVYQQRLRQRSAQIYHVCPECREEGFMLQGGCGSCILCGYTKCD